MFKYLRLIFLMGIFIIWDYFAWMVPYSRHPERYPLELRYAKARKLVLRLVKADHIDFHVENLPPFEKGKPFVIVGNHLSFLDPIMLIAISPTPLLFVGKNEARHYPFIGRIFRALSGEFIDRQNLKQELQVVRKIEASLRNPTYSWAIYPEGTRNKEPDSPMLPFKPGTFRIPLATNTPILPYVSTGNVRPLAYKIWWKSYPMQMRFLPVITPEAFAGKTSVDLAEEVYALMSAQLAELKKTDQILALEAQKKKRSKHR